MFGFGWVRTHLGDVFLESIRVFFCFWLDLWKNGQKLENLGIIGLLCCSVGNLRRGIDLSQGVGYPHRGEARCQNGTPRVRRGVAKLRCGEGLHRSIAIIRRGIALFTEMCFCHVLLFYYSEDLSIGLMRTLKVYERVHSCL